MIVKLAVRHLAMVVVKEYVMNDRITALANQADREGNQYGRIYMDYKKFAELIVQECAKIAFQHDIAKFSRNGMEIGLAIELHFGVD